MKIAFVTTGDIQSIATSKRAFGLAEPLTRLGYEVAIVAEDTKNNRIRLEHEAPSAHPLWFDGCGAFEEMRRKKEILRDYQADFVYVSALGLRNFAWSPSLARSSTYLIEHSELASAIKNQGRLRRLAATMLEQSSFFLFHGHIAASRYLYDFVRKGLSRWRQKGRVLYSPYAYSASMLSPDPEMTASLREMVRGRSVVVYMGTLAENYGILDIIEAIGNLRRKLPNVLLLVLGKGRDYVRAQKKVEAMELRDHVRLEGYVSDSAMPSYLEVADAFISPLYDTVQDIARCPSKLFLYLPFKRPIVTSKIGEAETLFGDYDFYFRPGDVHDMTIALDRALSRGSDWPAPWNPDDHSWNHRAKEFDEWLRDLKSTGVSSSRERC